MTVVRKNISQRTLDYILQEMDAEEMKSNEVLRVTGRKDKYGEVEEFICNDCRFDYKELKDWTVEGPRTIERHSVISQNHYETVAGISVIAPK